MTDHLAGMPWMKFSMRYVAQDRRCRLFTDAFAAKGFDVSYKEYLINRKTTDNLVCPQVDLPEDFPAYLANQVSANRRQKYARLKRDHLDSGSVASPNRETEAMKDGSDAVSDWPLLNALLNTASGATWVSLHHGGGVGMGFSQHSGMVICCDGSEDADRRIERVLWNDPATGVMRHADAGYDEALDCAREHGLDLPGIL